MEISFEAILYYFVAFDALVAAFLAWSGKGVAINKHAGFFSRWFPITRGWTLYYLILVLWIGYTLTRLDVI